MDRRTTAIIDERALRQLVAQKLAVQAICETLGLDPAKVKRIHIDLNAMEFDAPASIVIEHLLYNRELQEIISTINHFTLVANPDKDVEHREHVGPLQ